jgi:hypothetical protein
MTSQFFKEAWQKEKDEMNPLGRPNKRKNLKVNYHQTGKTNRARDIVRKALAPGKRISKTGHTYWESRRSRSDLPNSTL